VSYRATSQMKLSPLILSVLLIACCPSLADQDGRFVEFPELPAKTRIYDLHTVQMIQPGRFTILSTSIDDADVMRFELKALYTLRSYCKRPDESYPPPTDLFTLGPPDLPIKSIEVRSSQTKLGQFKSATWHYPYKRLAIEDRDGTFVQDEAYFYCKDAVHQKDEGELYLKQRTSITNGSQTKELFDCKRGLRGNFVTLDEEPAGPDRFWPSDPAKVHTDVVTPHSYSDLWYRGVCLRVMHETPYSPK
jgi:hypothetical protein